MPHFNGPHHAPTSTSSDVDTNFRGGPMGDFSGDFGPNDGLHVEASRGEGDALNPFDAESSFTVTLPDGGTISGSADSVIKLESESEGTVCIHADSASLEASATADDGEANFEATITVAKGESYTITGSMEYTDDRYLTVELDINGDEEGGEIDFVLDTEDLTLEMTGLDGETTTIDLDEMVSTIHDLAETYGDYVDDDYADAA